MDPKSTQKPTLSHLKLKPCHGLQHNLQNCLGLSHSIEEGSPHTEKPRGLEVEEKMVRNNTIKLNYKLVVKKLQRVEKLMVSTTPQKVQKNWRVGGWPKHCYIKYSQ